MIKICIFTENYVYILSNDFYYSTKQKKSHRKKCSIQTADFFICFDTVGLILKVVVIRISYLRLSLLWFTLKTEISTRKNIIWRWITTAPSTIIKYYSFYCTLTVLDVILYFFRPGTVCAYGGFNLEFTIFYHLCDLIYTNCVMQSKYQLHTSKLFVAFKIITHFALHWRHIQYGRHPRLVFDKVYIIFRLLKLLAQINTIKASINPR